MRAHGIRNSRPNQLWHGDQTGGEENFYRIDHVPCHGHFFVSRILTRDLFATANLLVFIVIVLSLQPAQPFYSAVCA